MGGRSYPEFRIVPQRLLKIDKSRAQSISSQDYVDLLSYLNANYIVEKNWKQNYRSVKKLSNYIHQYFDLLSIMSIIKQLLN